ncbi:MAG: NAD-binding protein [Owenweeksia sp.]|nr:NAD-binding protein [Owenweeksia sp.]
MAAAVASLFSLQLTTGSGGSTINTAQAELILPLTFLVIVGTVILQGSTAKPLAKLLKVEREIPRGYLIAGANENARFIAQFLLDQKAEVLLADRSKTNIREAQRKGFKVYEGNILGDSVLDELDLTSIGKLLALTSSAEVNNLSLKYFENELGDESVYRISSKNEQDMKDIELPKNVLFQARVDYLDLAQAIRQHQKVKIVPCGDAEEYALIEKSEKSKIIPLFKLTEEEDPVIIQRDLPDFAKGDKLAYIPMSS